MESPKKAETRKAVHTRPRKGSQNDSEDELQPPSPIDIATEPALSPDFAFPDAQELRRIESDTHNRLKAILEVAGVTGLSQIDARTFQDPEILRKLTNSVSTALDEAATALTRMKSEKQSYEAFLRGANQAPSPSQQETPPSNPPQSSNGHTKTTLTGSCQPPPKTAPHSQTPVDTRAETPPLPAHTHAKVPSNPVRQPANPTAGPRQSSKAASQQNRRSETPPLPTQAPASAKPSGNAGRPATKPVQPVVARLETPPPEEAQQTQSLQQQASDSMQSLQRLLTQGHTIQDATEDGESLLSLACSAGYYELAEVLLRMRASVEDRGVKGDSTPLMEAASGGYSDIVKLLIDHGANVNAKSSVGNTALTYACCGGYEEVVRILLEAGADVEHQNENGHTPLMEAASCGHVGVAKQLLDHGANINTHSNEFKESALTLACYKGHLEMVKFLLSAGADQEHKTDEMHTALMEASMDGHVDVARLLLDHGAQVNMPVDSFESPLTLAACGGHYELAALLISRGADLEEVNDEGYTPLMEAAREGHEDVVQLLVEHGANVNSQTEETQETALTLACCGGFIEVAQYLIDHGADIELGASTPLMEAAQEGHVNIVKFLMDKGALINAETNTGDTALTYACANGHTHIADILLQCGAELEHESEGGRTPLMKAARAGHLQTVQFLVSKGANINRRTVNNDHTVLSLASAGGHISVVQYLLIKGALPTHLLRDNSTMLIEASRGGHANVANLLLRQPRHLPRMVPSPEPSAEVPNRLPGTESRERKGGRKTEATRSTQPSKDQVVPDSSHHKSGVKSQTRDSNNTGLGVKRLKMAEPEHTPKQQTAASLSNAGPPKVYPTVKSTAAAAGTSVDVPTSQSPLIQALPNQLSHLPSPAQVTHPPGCHMTGSDVIKDHTTGDDVMMTGTDVIKEHPTADTIIEEYWKQRKVLEPLQQNLPVSTALPAGFENAQSVFSAGNFSSMPIPGGTGPGRGNEQESGSVDDQNPLANINLTRLLPTLEALAGSLQDPNSLESRYLAALSTHAQMMQLAQLPDKLPDESDDDSPLGEPPPLLSNGLDALPHTSEGGPPVHIPVAGLDTPALLSSADIASLLPNLANFDPSSADYLSRQLEDGQSDSQAPIYPTNYYHTMKQLSDRMQSIAASVGRGNAAEGEAQDVKGELPTQQTQSSLLLDSNFPMDDIPPPDNYNYLPGYEESGYEESLDNETCAYPTSEEEAGNEEDDDGMDGDESDTSYIVPDLSSNGALPPGSFDPAIDIEQETESNHDTALTLAAAGGHDELVELLLAHGANIEHRDKKGCTSLILAASAGHAVTVAILLDHSANIEAQSDRTKDTALSLACSGGRQEVVELLLAKGANFEHRNVSDYTPLSLAASGGYVNIIKLLLRAGADINSRTGSKLGISPLMLAAMNGHTSTVKLLLDMGSDINAQIETNRNTALTLACFQGRHEVVLLLVERQANVEHRAKTGLTPLMEAASGGYHEVGKVLISKGADVNAAPVPSSKDTALTIAADKGHFKFVELILRNGAFVDVKNKKGNSPLWLTCNGGHVDVVRLLVQYGADVDSQDNRKISSLMVAFKRGHLKVVKFLVDHVTQFPSDAELTRYISNITDKDLLKKCQRCMEVIIDAKERQAAEANKNATSLLLEIDQEKKHEEDRKAAAARKRAKKKRQKEKKQALKAQKDVCEEKGEDGGNGDSPHENEPGDGSGGPDDEEDLPEPASTQPPQNNRLPVQEPQVSPPTKPKSIDNSYQQNKKNSSVSGDSNKGKQDTNVRQTESISIKTHRNPDVSKESENRVLLIKSPSIKHAERPFTLAKKESTEHGTSAVSRASSRKTRNTALKPQVGGVTTPTNSPRKGRREDGWKEVGRRTKKVSVPSGVFGQVVGKNSANLSAIKTGTSTQIEIDKVPSKQSANRSLTIRGSTDAVKLAHQCISSLIKDPNQDLTQLIRKITGAPSTSTAQKRYVSPSNDPNPTSDPLLELPGAPPATGSTTAPAFTSVSTTCTIAPSSGNQAKTLQKKSSGLQIVTNASGVMTMAGNSINSQATTVVTTSHEHRDGRPTSGAQLTRVSTIGSLLTQTVPSNSVPISLVRTSSAGSVPHPTSGAVRKLFVTTTPTTKHSANPQATRATTQGLTRQAPTRSSGKASSSNPTQQDSAPSKANVEPVAKSVNIHPLTQQVPTGGDPKHMSYSRVIASQDGPRSQHSEVIEQPVQQIMKTPAIFQDAATQLAKPKKISTYSDAVGKKHQAASTNVSGAATSVSYVNSDARMGQLGQAHEQQGAPLVSPPPQLQAIKLNLAPGSRLVGPGSAGETVEKPALVTTEKRSSSRGVPWSEVVDKTSPDYHQQSFDEDSKDKLSPPSLGPIGPPSKSGKSASSAPSSANAVGGPVKPRSYSPGSRPKTSPACVSASPQRNELSPAAKSPLLGPAPPGLLPPPDKGFSSSFRPIPGGDYPAQGDTSGSSTSSGTFQTLVPTPVRNQRPPLLATPPGLSMLQQGVRPGSVTPVPSPEKNSPNKSPPHPAMKGFNPNAPTFVPMALQPGPRPAVPSTSSILGAPPTAKYPGYGPPAAVAGGSSILGAPQIPPMYGNSSSQPRMVSPVPSIFPSQPPPSNVIQPPVPQAQQQQTQPAGGQTSILGQPPPIYLPQGFAPTIQNQPPSGMFGQVEAQPPPQTIQHAQPFGINLIPFQVNGQQQPGQNFVAAQPSQVLVSTPIAEGFQVQADSQQQGAVMVSVNSSEFSKIAASMAHPGKPGEPAVIDLRQMGVNAGLNISAHGPVLISGATHSPTLPITSTGVTGVRSSDNLFNLSIDSFSGLYPNTQPPQGEAKDPKAPVDGLYSKGTNVAMTGEGAVGDGLPPIGTERVAPIGSGRAQKSSAMPYTVLTPGILPSVWSYSGSTASEDSDWSKVPKETSWPSLPGQDSLTPHDTLESVLGRLGLLDYYPLLQRNEIDLNALMLMNDKDFAEIGLPPGPRQTLLLGIGRLSTMNSLDKPVSKVSSDGGVSSPPIAQDQGPSSVMGPASASQ